MAIRRYTSHLAVHTQTQTQKESEAFKTHCWCGLVFFQYLTFSFIFVEVVCSCLFVNYRSMVVDAGTYNYQIIVIQMQLILFFLAVIILQRAEELGKGSFISTIISKTYLGIFVLFIYIPGNI